MSDAWYDPMNPQPDRQPLWVTGLLALAGIVGAVFVVPGILMVAMFFGVWLMTWPGPDKDFNASEWQEANGQQRWRMHDDLLESGELQGKTVDEIVQLLGCQSPPDHCEPRTLTYFMGPNHGALPVDSDWLRLDFLPDGTFWRARVVSD